MAEERPRGRGITTRFVDSQDYIVEATWNDAVARHQPVGECRRVGCGGLLMGRPSRKESEKLWFEAECNSCGGTVAAADGRVLRRSTRHDEMPKGWLGARNEALRKAHEFKKTGG